MRRLAVAMAVVFVSVMLTGCGGGGTETPTPGPSETDRSPDQVDYDYDPSQPWVITAVDNHFHDSHPTPLLDPDSVLIVKNDGSNLHNVTFVGTGFSEDIAPGEEITIDPIRDLLAPPGPWTLVCTYHASQGMKGTIRFATG